MYVGDPGVQVGLWWFLLALFIFGPLAGGAWQRKGGSWWIGYLVGAALGVFGLAYALLSTPRNPQGRRECPHCKELMWADARVCPHCQRESDPELPGVGHCAFCGEGVIWDENAEEWYHARTGRVEGKGHEAVAAPQQR